MNNIDRKILPSNGTVKGVPKEVTIRGMKGVEISTIYSSLTEASIDEVIKAVTDDGQIDVDLLTDEDKLFILLETRKLTFGPEVKQSLRCPFCNHIHEYTIDLDNLPIHLLDETNFNDIITLSSGDTVTKRLPNKLTYEEIENARIKFNYPPTYNFILGIASKIDKINGRRLTIREQVEWLENLDGKLLVEVAESINFVYGVENTYIVNCVKCGTNFTGGVGLNADLFR